jgi:hypothetical protein
LQDQCHFGSSCNVLCFVEPVISGFFEERLRMREISKIDNDFVLFGTLANGMVKPSESEVTIRLGSKAKHI